LRYSLNKQSSITDLNILSQELNIENHNLSEPFKRNECSVGFKSFIIFREKK